MIAISAACLQMYHLFPWFFPWDPELCVCLKVFDICNPVEFNFSQFMRHGGAGFQCLPLWTEDWVDLKFRLCNPCLCTSGEQLEPIYGYITQIFIISNIVTLRMNKDKHMYMYKDYTFNYKASAADHKVNAFRQGKRCGSQEARYSTPSLRRTPRAVIFCPASRGSG